MDDYAQLLDELYSEPEEILDFHLCTNFSPLTPDGESILPHKRKKNFIV